MDGGAAAMALGSYSDQVQRRGPPRLRGGPLKNRVWAVALCGR